MLIDYIKEMWLKYGPHFLCKEARRQEENRLAELAIIDEYVKKNELFLQLKGLKVCCILHNPKYKRSLNKYGGYYLAHIEDENDRMLTSYSVFKTEQEAKQDAIYKYLRKYKKSYV